MQGRFYFDTSVFGGVFDDEFKKESIQLFEQVKRGRVVCLYSEVVLNELLGAPDKVRLYVESLPKEFMEKIISIDAVKRLAENYVLEKIVGSDGYEDCLHIALATVYHADLLVSWNFKHIVNTRRIIGYNSINLKNGYHEIRICSPKEIKFPEVF
ncbi:MAG: PIN domain protein [Bacteroidota bacterium]